MFCHRTSLKKKNIWPRGDSNLCRAKKKQCCLALGLMHPFWDE